MSFFTSDNETLLVTDPRGREVILPTTLCLAGAGEKPGDYLDGFQKAIQAPACMIELSSNELFYFRSIGWNITVLIRVVFIEDAWKAVECMENPDPEFIQEQLKEGTFIPGSVLD